MAQVGFFDSCATGSSEPHAAHVGETSAPGRRESPCFLVGKANWRAASAKPEPTQHSGCSFKALPHALVSHVNNRRSALNQRLAAKRPKQLAGVHLSERRKTSTDFYKPSAIYKNRRGLAST